MIIKNIASYLENLKQRDIKPEIFTVWPFPEGLTVLEILNSIGYKLAHLWDSVKINTTTETTDDNAAQVNVSGDVDQLNFDFKIPRGKDGEKGDPGVSVTVGETTTLPAGEPASVTNSGTASDPVLNFGIPQGAKGDKGEPGPDNLVMVTATASTTTQGDYTPDTAFADALSDIQANKVVIIKLENVTGRYYMPYSSSNAEILASAGTVSGSKQSIELYTLKWTASSNIITLTGTKEGCTADGGTKGQVLAKKSDESFDTEWIDPGTGFLINANAGAHNSIYRGKYLGTSVTAAQYAAIASGTFDDLYIGDYWTIERVNYRIAGFNYFLNTGNLPCTTNHAVIVPDTSLYNAAMNNTNTTNGGYIGSDMYTVNLEQAKTTIKSAFNNHVLKHNLYLTNGTDNGISSNVAWCESEVDLMCEQMVYGNGIFSPVSNGSNIPANYRLEKSQLPLFQHEPSRITNGEAWWLRDVISTAHFADIYSHGAADHSGASNSYGVRPFFCIY